METTFRLLFDEDTGAKFAQLCSKEGHDVTRVVEIAELGAGTPDSEVRAYAASTDRILVTHDDDHTGVDPGDHAGVFYAPSQRASAVKQYRIVSAIASSVDSVDDLPPVVYLTEDWL